MRIFVAALEYCQPFSGNGILLRTIVAGLLLEGHEVMICTFSNKPQENDSSSSLKILTTSCPEHKLKYLDKRSGFEELSIFVSQNLEKIRDFNPSILLGVDWSGVYAMDSVRQQLGTPSLYLVFRVFFRSKELFTEPSDADLYLRHESAAVLNTTASIVLCRADKSALVSHLKMSEVELEKRIHILHPPLRQDFVDLILNDRIQSTAEDVVSPACDSRDYVLPRSSYLLCNARFSAEKNVIGFLELVEDLQELLIAEKITPLLCGARVDDSYTKTLESKIASLHIPVVVVSEFLSAERLVHFLKSTVLNIHPAIHDAFGMTVVEAAAIGVPSVVHVGDVGAKDLLATDEYFAVDFKDRRDVSQRVSQLILSPDIIAGTGRKAQNCALQWTPHHYIHALVKLLKAAILSE